ncbi:hypothetical protein F5Y05DRAFT_177372 [Hypoxylon sp. FL0543]|nr:hypothetical protein F5Y05DRAFT_177372 [Hypoxylon sp. FL0543]
MRLACNYSTLSVSVSLSLLHTTLIYISRISLGYTLNHAQNSPPTRRTGRSATIWMNIILCSKRTCVASCHACHRAVSVHPFAPTKYSFFFYVD